ncbi:MAG: carboxypeptidase-like regulatory domain-containing protein, partial [Candidatus Solibacter sp.]|nr:carboxypeptidase-like regulatory domain-containing protein [Candidatus Solibacter sp.]
MSRHIPHFSSKVVRNALLVAAILASACTLMAQAGPQGEFVGTVKDSTGASAPGVKVTVVNTGTQFVSEGVTNTEGNYNIPYLNSGIYRITFVAAGFKQFVRDGIDLRPGETPRFDVSLEVGSASESVTVTAAAPLLTTESAAVSHSMDQAILQDISNVSKRIVRDLYFVPGVIGSANTGYHILGNVQRSIGYSMDGVSAKWPGLGTFDQNDQVLQTTQDALEEVKVLTSVASAEVGHAAGGGMQLTFKSGTNEPHLSVEDRVLYTPMVHRSYFQQTPSLPFSYYEFESVFSGPLYIPKLYNGKSRTFFLFGFAQHHENWDTENTVSVPTAGMLGGDFSFGGVGYPIYDPKSYRQVNGVWTADRFPNNIVPTNRFDPVSVNFLAQNPWSKANMPGITTASGTSSNFLSDGTKIVTRTRWDVKVDHQFSAAHKFAARYSQGHHRAQANGIQTQLAWRYLDLNSIKQ